MGWAFAQPLGSVPDAQVCLDALGSAADRRAYFLLLRQKNVAKEKATPRSAPGYARSLALLGRPGVSLNSPTAQTTRDEPPRPACVAQRLPGGPEHLAYPETNFASSSAVFPGPLRGAEQRRAVGGLRLALSEPKASLASRPTARVAQGTGVAGTDPGGAFFLATFSWPPKKKYARRSTAKPGGPLTQ